MSVVRTINWILKGNSGTSATIQTLFFRVLIIAVNVATGVITARYLGPEGRGEQAALILFPQLLAYAMTLGLPSALLFNIKRHPEEQPKLFSAALILGVVLGLLATVIGIILIPNWLSQYSIQTIHHAQWLMLNATLTLLWLILTAAFDAYEDFAVANQMRYLPPISALTVLLVLAWTHTLTPLTAAMAYLLPGLPIFFWMLFRVWQTVQPRWRSLGSAYRSLLSYGFRSYGIDLLKTLEGQLDQALIVGLLSPAAMGIYVVALSLSRMLNIFQNSVIVVLFPKASARPVHEVMLLVGRTARISLALAVVAGICVALLGPHLLRLLYGSEFVESVALVRVLIVQVIFDGVVLVLAQAFMALERPGMITVLQAIGLGLTLPLLLLLIPQFGALGAGLSLLGSTTVRLIFVLLSFPVILKVSPPQLLLTHSDIRFLRQKILERA